MGETAGQPQRLPSCLGCVGRVSDWGYPHAPVWGIIMIHGNHIVLEDWQASQVGRRVRERWLYFLFPAEAAIN